MEGRICFEYRWGLKPVLVYTLCHFDFDCHNKRSNTPNNMSSRKRSNTSWSTNTFAPSVLAICIARTICHRLGAAICIAQPKCNPESAAIYIDYINMPPKFFFFFPTGGVFFTPLSGEIFSHSFFAICTPGRLLFVYSLFPSCPVDHGPDRKPLFVFLGGLS